MSHSLAIIVLAASGATLVIAGILFFRQPHLFVTWLKGMAVFCSILAGLYALVIAVNLTNYQEMGGMQTIATITTKRQAEQIWEVSLDRPNGVSVARTLQGDQWQIDSRILRFSGPLQWLDFTPGYRLERLRGRYTSLEQEWSSPKTAIASSSAIWPDIWKWDQQFNLPFIEAVDGNSTFMPMRDGAVFDVKVSFSGLVAVPVNEQARAAVQFWNQ
ncbi:multidrug transporter [Marinobacter sp. F3R08]|uniref:multidrug transporter n=1 Tax=Marinobacter sp. F3R08 TaxID=2841559 RepID=UPI001C09B36A|nr:multidrug transporter [Marinobacter sp. F3R08]MBU2955713.1 multidrug transporter [Marinobacter sp. F3R08]